MIDTRNLNFDGRRRNHQNGLTFYFAKRGHVLSFLIDVIGDKKRKIKVTMHPDSNHGRAHVHINEHGASFAVDTGELLAGECDHQTRKMMKDWILRHQKDLLQLWNIIKRGERYQPAVEKIRYEKSFEEFGFSGNEPLYKTEIDKVVIWHNEELLVERDDDGIILVVGVGDMYVVFPKDYPEEHIRIEALSGDIKVRRIAAWQ